MSLLGRFLSIIMLQRSLVASVPVLHRLVATMAALLVLVMVGVVVFGLLLACCLYIAYTLLLSYGFTPLVSLILITITLASIALVIMSYVARCIQKLDSIPMQLWQARRPMTARAGSVGNAFLDGLLNPSQSAKASK